MLSVGVPMRAVKHHMLISGSDPNTLDDFSFRRIRYLKDRPRDDGWHEVWEGEYSGVSKSWVGVCVLQKEKSHVKWLCVCSTIVC